MPSSKSIISFCFLLLSLCNPTPVFKDISGDVNLYNYYEDEWSCLEKNYNEKNGGENRVLLPKTILPTDYILTLVLNMDTKDLKDAESQPIEMNTCAGEVTITILPLAETNNIILHASEMTIDESSVKVKNLKRNEINKVISQEYEIENEFFKMSLETPLIVREKYEVRMKFTSSISSDRLDGIYKSNYTVTTENGFEIRHSPYLATTQFEPADARKAFPCFDEPSLKSRFEITIGRSGNYHSLSNMNRKSTKPIPGIDNYYWDRYEVTPVMSTYLIAFIVSDYKFQLADLDLYRGKPVKVWTTGANIESSKGKHSAMTGAKILSYYEQYFNYEYPLPKMDMVAIPHFAAGAMENYGLNTYREKLLLVGTNDSQIYIYRVTSTVAHELAHQYFGNLVTCRTWNHLWLNEGFATYISYIGVQKTNPEFSPNLLFINEVQQSAFKVDADENKTHPLVVKNETMTGYFDAITYRKGASVLKMIEGFLGESTMQKGLQTYLAKKAFGNVVQDDLFEVLQEQATKDGTISKYLTVKEVLDTWTFKSGYPLIRVSKSSKNSKQYYFTQEKFFERNGKAKEFNELWWVPITLKTLKERKDQQYDEMFWMRNDTATLLYTFSEEPQQLLVNSDSKGFYRVLYDNGLTKSFSKQLTTDHTAYPETFRSKLIDDYFHLAFKRYIPIDHALELTKYLGNEVEYLVWSSVFSNIKPLYITNSYEDIQEFKKYFLPLIQSALDKIGMEILPNEKGTIVFLKSKLLSWACDLQGESCIDHLTKIFKHWTVDKDYAKISPDIIPLVFCTAITNDMDKGGNSNFNFVLEKYKNEKDKRYRTSLLVSLGCSKRENRIEDLLENLMDPEFGASKDDMVQTIQRIASNKQGKVIVWKYIEDNFDRIVQLLGSVEQVTKIIETLSLSWNKNEELIQLNAFIEKNLEKLTNNMKSLENSKKMIKENIDWNIYLYQPIKNWLNKQIIISNNF